MRLTSGGSYFSKNLKLICTVLGLSFTYYFYLLGTSGRWILGPVIDVHGSVDELIPGPVSGNVGDEVVESVTSVEDVQVSSVTYQDLGLEDTSSSGSASSVEPVENEITEETERSSSLFLRENEQLACRIPKLNPFDASVLPYNVIPSPANCENEYPLLFRTDLDSTLIQVKDPSDFGYFDCCYRSFQRKKKDREIVESKECHKVTAKTVIPNDVEFITVYCDKMKNDSTKVQTAVDMFQFIHLKPKVEQRASLNEVNSKGQEARKVNVVVLGIDAVSHMNFLRTMPQSAKYLKEELNAVGLDGYTKVGDNTFPNIIPVTTGMTVEELRQHCWPTDQTPFDKCPFIWKNYSDQGYRTAYGEDAVWMGIFNYVKRGFANQPTDYYNNAFTYRMEEKIGNHHMVNCKLCYGPRIGFQVSLDYLQKLAYRMGTTRRYFQFIWATSLFHDYLNSGKLGDPFLLETLKWFKNESYLEDTVLILMSDHGIRWGDIRSTLQGKIEERMPFLYFVFPEWFKEQYRSAVSNLIRNRPRLTTPFDLHETLVDFLNLNSLSDENLKQRYKKLASAAQMPRGISLFLPIPVQRTCKDAGIEDHWCVCQTGVPVFDTSIQIIQEAALNVVEHINRLFINFPQCVPLRLDSVLNAQVMQTNNTKVKDYSLKVINSKDRRLKKQQFTCSVSISVLPSNGTFEATITRHTDGSWVVSGDISRTNLYGSQSHCVTDYNLKKFCYCS